MTDLQPCGHDYSHRKPTSDNRGTWCDACLPDDTLETYVRLNVAQFTTEHEVYAAASVPPGLGGKVAVSLFHTADEAREFLADFINEAWVIGPDGEVHHHHPGAQA